MSEIALKVLIVDDEKLARQKIVRYLTELAPDVEFKEAANGIEAVATVKDFAPDIVFLDIQMPGLNGFEVLDHFAERSFAVIFQTAFDEFAIKAFEECACDYLLKPYTQERFAKAFERARTAGSQNNPAHDSKRNLLQKITEAQQFVETLCVSDRGVYLTLGIQEVEAFVSRDHYTCIHSGPKEYLLDLSLQKLEERLNPADYLRIHRSAIIRVAAVTSMTKGEDAEVELTSGLKLPVSRRCRRALTERLRGALR